MKHIFFAIALGIIGFFIYLTIYLGAFRPVEIAVETKGPYTMIYKIHRGPYHKIVPVIEEVEAWVRKEGIDKCTKSFGQYLDDVALVEEERLTSRGGCVLESPAPANLPEGYEVMTLPQERYIVAYFTGSPGIGPIKVYPKVKDFARSENLKLSGPVIEIYEVLADDAMNTEYLFSMEQ